MEGASAAANSTVFNATNTSKPSPHVSAGNMLANATGQMVAKAAHDVDGTLKLVTRIIALVSLLVLLGLIILLCKQKVCRAAIEDKFHSIMRVVEVGWSRKRYWKSCCIYTFGCGCIPKIYKYMGYEELQRPKMSLVMTFIAAKALKKPGKFYFEVWTEPEEGPRKNTSSFIGPGDSSLNSERVELNWHGDEDRVVIGMNEYTGTQIGNHRPRGEIELSLQDLHAIIDGDDGVRRLSLDCHEGLEMKQKLLSRRMNVATNPLAIVVKQGVESLQQVSYEKFGEEYPDTKTIEKLERENEQLRKELGDRAKTIPKTANKSDAAPERIGDVIVKFSFEEKVLQDHAKYEKLTSMNSQSFK